MQGPGFKKKKQHLHSVKQLPLLKDEILHLLIEADFDINHNAQHAEGSIGVSRMSNQLSKQ